MNPQKELWECHFADDSGSQHVLHIEASPPFAQASAEVAGIKRLSLEHEGVRCVFSRFLKEVP